MISIKKGSEHTDKPQWLSEYLKIDKEHGRSDSDDSPEDADEAAKERALTSLLRKLAYEDFSALEKAALIDEDTCTCDSCKDRRAWTNETLEEFKLIQSYWLELRQYLRIIYRLGMKGSITTIDENYHSYMKELVARLCEVCNPHQLYQRLEAQVREFVMEIKMRLLQLMDRLAENPQLPRLFLSGMLDRYNKMMNAANEITPVLIQLETEHLSQFNLTWKMLNQRLFQTSIYTDPFFQNSVPLFTSQLSKGTESDENRTLIKQFLNFDDEITLVEGMWKDVETRIHQYTKDHAMMSRQRFLKEEYLNDLKALRRIRLKNCNNNRIGTPETRKNNAREDVQAEECIIDSEDICECHVCLDASAHAPVDLMDQVVSPSLHGGGFHLYPHIHGTGGSIIDGYSHNIKVKISADETENPKHATSKFIRPDSYPPRKKSTSPQKRVDKATQKDNEVLHSVELEFIKNQDRVQHSICVGTKPNKENEDLNESSTHQFSCLKHSDTVKRIPCPEQEEEVNSGSSNNPEDSHSENSQPDPRHCDCCYCEVFGHGIPTAAPMSRNYQEMRERLRLLLNKKKSKCKSSSASPQRPAQTSKYVNPKPEGYQKACNIGDRDLEDLLVYIEGTDVKCRNEKRAAKKARQREKKQILMRTRQLQEEEKALRLKEALDAKRREEALARATKDEKEQGQSKKTSKNQDQPTQATQKQHLSVPSSPGPQMVTIKRVMEPHNSEPTVTITLRGATPNQDKVLYTLLNGQVCKSTKLPFANGLATNSKNNGKLVPQNLAAQQQQCGKKNKLKKDFEMLQNSATIVPAPPAPTPTIVKISNPASIQIDSSLNKISPKSINPKPFNLDDIKLPPGITITKVDPSMVHSKNLLKERHPHKFPPISQIRSPPASEVIVVATGKLKEPTQLPQSKECNTNVDSPGNKKKGNNNKNKSEHTDEEIITHSTVVGGKKKKNKKKIDNIGAPMFNSNAVYPGVEIEPIDNILVKQHSIANAPTVSICPRIFQQHPTNQNQLSLSTQCLEQGRKKKKKIKKALANNNNINPEELSLLDSVFAPKDIDLDGEMDDDERELEAFKRFCSQSVPPKQKEKVYLNLKDIVLKKKSSQISCS